MWDYTKHAVWCYSRIGGTICDCHVAWDADKRRRMEKRASARRKMEKRASASR